MGVSGAAVATVISASIASVLIFYWLLLKRDTYVSLSRKDFNTSWNVIKDILLVGLPASAEFFVMSILGIVVNIMLVLTGGTEAVAVYTAGWRVVMIAMIPAIGIGTAAITVAGAAYGSRRYNNISTALNYSAKLAIGIASITGLIIYFFASNIAYSYQSAMMTPSIAAFLQVMCLFLIIVPLGITASSVFQGMGKGLTSLILTVIREVLFISVFAYFLSFVLGIGEHGIWWGIIIGGAFGCAIAFIWATRYIKALKKSYHKEDNIEYRGIPGKIGKNNKINKWEVYDILFS